MSRAGVADECGLMDVAIGDELDCDIAGAGARERQVTPSRVLSRKYLH